MKNEPLNYVNYYFSYSSEVNYDKQLVYDCLLKREITFSLEPWNYEGFIDLFHINNLQNYSRDELYIKLESDICYDNECEGFNFQILHERYETDEEINKRINREKKSIKEREKKSKVIDKKSDEYKQYLKLKRKFN